MPRGLVQSDMAIITAQQILDYYEKYRDVEVTFTKEVIQATGLVANQNLLKSLGDFWPCAPYSASMVGAKVIANLNARFFEAMRTANNLLTVRLSFRLQDRPDPVSLFITARAAGFNRYSKENPDVYFLNLTFSQKPPDDFIYIVGRLLDANLTATQRKEERIIINVDSARALGLRAKETRVAVGDQTRGCIIRDISFSGVKVLLMGASSEMVGKAARIAVAFDEEDTAFVLEGSVVRFEAVQGRKDIGAIAIKYDESRVPIRYKVLINAYVKRVRLADVTAAGQGQSGPDAKPEAGYAAGALGVAGSDPARR